MFDSSPAVSTTNSQVPSRVEMLTRLGSTALRDHRLMSIADQLVVSATNFLTGVVVGRGAGEEALGAYSLAFSVMLLMLCVQQSLICFPYTVKICHAVDTDKRRLTENAFSQSLLLCVILCAALLLGIAAVASQIDRSVLILAAAFSIALPFAMLRDFARRVSFARFSTWTAFAIDTAVLALQIVLMALLWQFDMLSAGTAYFAIGAACAAATLCWAWQRRSELAFSPRNAVRELRSDWQLGSWVFASQIVTVVNSYLIFWLAAVKLGVMASGILAACNVIVQFSNPILLGTYNMLSPRLAAANATGGAEAVPRVARMTTLFLAAVMGTFTLLSFLLGGVVVRTLYGDAYAVAEVGLVCGLLGLAEFAAALGGPADQTLWVKHRPALSFLAGLVGLGCMLAGGLTLITTWGLVGVVASLVLGNSVASAIRWYLFRRLVGTPIWSEQS